MRDTKAKLGDLGDGPRLTTVKKQTYDWAYVGKEISHKQWLM